MAAQFVPKSCAVTDGYQSERDHHFLVNCFTDIVITKATVNHNGKEEVVNAVHGGDFKGYSVLSNYRMSYPRNKWSVSANYYLINRMGIARSCDYHTYDITTRRMHCVT